MSWIGPKMRAPLRPMSNKRRRELKARKAVREAVAERDGGVCAARDLLAHECSGEMDPHELIRRSQWRGGYLVLSNVITVCRTAHDWIGLHPHEAVELGLAKWSWQRDEV